MADPTAPKTEKPAREKLVPRNAAVTPEIDAKLEDIQFSRRYKTPQEVVRAALTEFVERHWDESLAPKS